MAVRGGQVRSGQVRHGCAVGVGNFKLYVVVVDPVTEPFPFPFLDVLAACYRPYIVSYISPTRPLVAAVAPSLLFLSTVTSHFVPLVNTICHLSHLLCQASVLRNREA